MTTAASGIVLGTNPIFDRPHLALLNILQGRPGAAVRSIWDPDTLSPDERQSAASRIGLAGTWLEPLLNVASNPLVIGGALGTLFTAPTHLKDFLRKSEGRLRGHLIEGFRPILDIVERTPLVRTLPAGYEAARGFTHDLSYPLVTAVHEFAKARGYTAVRAGELSTVIGHVERTLDPRSPWWREGFFQRLEDNGYADYAAKYAASLERGQAKIDRMFAKLGKPGEQLAKDYGEWRHKTYRMTVGDPQRGPYFRKNLKGFDAEELGIGSNFIPEELPNSFPHMPVQDDRGFQEMLESAAERHWGVGPKEIQQGAGTALPRLNQMLPDPKFVFRMTGDAGLTKVNGAMWRAAPVNRRTGKPMFYSVEPDKVLARYSHVLGNTFGWSVPPPLQYDYELSKTLTLPEVSPLDLDWRRDSAAGVLAPGRTNPEWAWSAGRHIPDAAMTTYDTDAPERAIAKAAWFATPRKGYTPDQTQLAEAHALMRDAIGQYEAMGQTGMVQRTHSLYAHVFPESFKNLGNAPYLSPKSYGELVNEQLSALSGPNATTAEMMAASRVRNVVMPQLMGGLSQRQVESANRWQAKLEWAHGKLTDAAKMPALAFAKPALERAARWIAENHPSYGTTGHAVTEYLTLSTIGGNPVSPLMNLTQITNQLLMGAGPTAQGVKHVWGKILGTDPRNPGYFMRRMKGELSHDALQAVFPEFYRMHLELDPTMGTMSEGAFDALYERFRTLGAAKTAKDKIASALMAPFRGSELINRLSSYYGARGGLLEGLPGTEYVFASGKRVMLPRNYKHRLVQEAATEGAAELVGTTQFGTGPLQRPVGTLEWWPPFSQYTTFPLRQLNLMLKLAGNPAWLSRAALMSGLMYGAGREVFQTDFSRMMMTGGIPQLTTGQAFSPVPVPPLLQLAGSAAMALGGETESLSRSWPLLVPGGVEASRAIGMIPGGQSVAQAVGRPYADYGNRSPDGRIPVYSAAGAMIGLYTPSQLLSKSMGLGDVVGEQEQALVKFTLRQRDEIRALKREYLDSAFQNDTTSMIDLQEKWNSRYPGMGPIPVSKADMRSVHLRHDVTRLERVLETIPPEMRPEFAAAISTAYGSNFPAVLGLAQPGLRPTTISLREPYRLLPQAGTEARLGTSLHAVKLQDKILQRAESDASNVRRPNSYYPETDLSSQEETP